MLHPRVRPVLFLLLFVFACLLGVRQLVRFGWTSPEFEVQHVHVRTDGTLSYQEILAPIKDQLRGNLFRVDIESLAAKIQSHPTVSRAAVERLWPNRLRIHVQERFPYARLQLGQRMYWIDRQGVIFEPPGRAVATDSLPTIVCHVRHGVGVLGQSVDSEGMRVALTLMELIRRRPALSQRLERIDSRDIQEVLVFLTPGFEVRMGGEEWADRMNRLVQILDKVQGDSRPIQYIDLRFDDVAVKFSDGPKGPIKARP